MKKKVRFGIFPKMLITMFIVALVPLSINWYLNYISSFTRLTNQIDQQLSTYSDGMVTYIDTWMEMNLKMTRQMASLDDMKSMETPKHNPLLRSIANEYKWIYVAHTIGLDGKNVGRSDNEAPKFYGDRGYYQQVLKGESFGSEVVIGRTNLKPAFALATAITNNEQKVVGVMSIAASVEDLSRNITNIKIGKTGYAFLMEDKGKVVAHQKEEFTKVLADFSKHPAMLGLGSASKKKVTFNDDKTNNKVVSFVQRTKHGWILVVQQDHEEAYIPIQEGNQRSVMVFAVTVVLVLVIAFVLARRLSQPILNLTQIADNLSRGELSAKIKEINRSDEIGELARAVERLGASMRLAIDRLSKR